VLHWYSSDCDYRYRPCTYVPYAYDTSAERNYLEDHIIVLIRAQHVLRCLVRSHIWLVPLLHQFLVGGGLITLLLVGYLIRKGFVSENAWGEAEKWVEYDG
jgi:hypothetical protein